MRAARRGRARAFGVPFEAMHLTVYNLAAVATVAAIVACVVFALRPWLVVMGWHPGRIHRAARRAEKHGLPVCGHCGHAVAPWSDTVRVPPNCGECGARYTRCGIVSRAAIARVSPCTAVIAALLAPPVFAVAWIVYGGTYELLTPGVAHSSQITAQPRPPIIRRTANFSLAPSRVEGRTIHDTTRYNEFDDPPPYQLMYELDLLGAGSPLNNAAITPTDGRAAIRLRGDGVPQAYLEYRPATDSWTLTGGAVGQPPAQGTGVDAAIAALFARGGLDGRPWAQAERIEAADRLTNGSPDGTVNGFVESGHPGEAAHAHDTAMTYMSLAGSGWGSSSVPHGHHPFGSGPPGITTPAPAYATPLAVVAGLIPVGVGVALVVMYGLRRSDLLWKASPDNPVLAGRPVLGDTDARRTDG